MVERRIKEIVNVSQSFSFWPKLHHIGMKQFHSLLTTLIRQEIKVEKWCNQAVMRKPIKRSEREREREREKQRTRGK